MILVDLISWAGALTVVTSLRWEGSTTHTFTSGLAIMIAISITSQLVFGWALLYRFTWKIGSFEELSALVMATGTTAGVVIIVDILAFRSAVPASSAIGGAALAFVFMIGARGGWRYWRELSHTLPEGMHGAIIFGAGDAGQQIIDLLISNDQRPYWPVAVLDDDPEKGNFQFRHLKIEGTRSDVARVANATKAKILIIAIPSADSDLIRSLTTIGEEAGLQVLVLPPVKEMITSKVSVTDIQPVSEIDLLGRRVIDTEIDAIAQYLTGKRVLVTGAGGSIGSELCRQIIRFGPSMLIMLDRDESGILETQLSIEGSAMLNSRNLVVCDIRDPEALGAVYDEHKPEVVFHAAALKHLPLLEMWPVEAYKTNVLGTLNVLSAAATHGIGTFVNISSDKAANPQSVLGYSKRIAERLTAGFKDDVASSNFVSVRFGNVLGSRGSVLPTFLSQVENGGPITVTHPEVTRYFMTIEEAVQLVIQAGALKGIGGVLILDMGAPVKIDDMAKRLAKNAVPPVEIVYTGLRPGEKLHEELIGDDEVGTPTDHPLIVGVVVPALSSNDIPMKVRMRTPTAVITALIRLANLNNQTNSDVDVNHDNGKVLE
jgi:FlaA1/EpsC-like NDP-sugar epimerase